MDPNEEGEEKKKEGWVNTLKLEYPELFRSDVSICPSYTNLTYPYPVVCRQRYHQAKDKYRKQFLKELQSMQDLQDRALDGVRMQRTFSLGLRVSTNLRRMKDPLTRNERRRVEALLADRRTFS